MFHFHLAILHVCTLMFGIGGLKKSYLIHSMTMFVHFIKNMHALCRLPKSRSESEVQTLVALPDLEQSPLWKCMISKHVGEEISLRQSHIEKQKELLLSTLGSKYHDCQRKELLSKQEVYVFI